MSFLQVIIMGVIQGLTEFLPVSSSGHLALFKILFGIEAETGILYEILLHVGTLAAICLVYYKDIFKLFAEGCRILRDALVNVVIFFRNQIKREHEEYRKVISNGYRKFVMLVLVSSIPTGVIGFFGRNAVALASQILLVPGICLIVTAVLLFIADHSRDGGKLPKALHTQTRLLSVFHGRRNAARTFARGNDELTGSFVRLSAQFCGQIFVYHVYPRNFGSACAGI